MGNALHMIETGMEIDAATALRMGLVQEVAPAGTTLERTLALAEHISNYSQGAIRVGREAALATIGLDLQEGLQVEVELCHRPSVSAEAMNVKDKVMSSPLGKRSADRRRPQPSLEEVRTQYGGPRLSDEELLLRYLVPAEDPGATRAAGPVKRGYDFEGTMSMNELLDHLLTLQRPRHVVVGGAAGNLVLKRGDAGTTVRTTHAAGGQA